MCFAADACAPYAVAGAGLLLGLVALVLRLIVTVMTALDGAAQYPTV